MIRTKFYVLFIIIIITKKHCFFTNQNGHNSQCGPKLMIGHTIFRLLIFIAEMMGCTSNMGLISYIIPITVLQAWVKSPMILQHPSTIAFLLCSTNDDLAVYVFSLWCVNEANWKFTVFKK